VSRVDYLPGAGPCLEVIFVVSRNLGYFLIQYYIPSILLVILSWVSFWISVDAVVARVNIGLLTVLTLTTQSTGSRDQLPRVSYIKAIDVWMSTCLVFAFASLIEFAIVNVWSRREARRAKLGGMATLKRALHNAPTQPTTATATTTTTTTTTNTGTTQQQQKQEKQANMTPVKTRALNNTLAPPTTTTATTTTVTTQQQQQQQQQQKQKQQTNMTQVKKRALHNTLAQPTITTTVIADDTDEQEDDKPQEQQQQQVRYRYTGRHTCTGTTHVYCTQRYLCLVRVLSQ